MSRKIRLVRFFKCGRAFGRFAINRQAFVGEVTRTGPVKRKLQHHRRHFRRLIPVPAISDACKCQCCLISTLENPTPDSVGLETRYELRDAAVCCVSLRA